MVRHKYLLDSRSCEGNSTCYFIIFVQRAMWTRLCLIQHNYYSPLADKVTWQKTSKTDISQHSWYQVNDISPWKSAQKMFETTEWRAKQKVPTLPPKIRHVSTKFHKETRQRTRIRLVTVPAFLWLRRIPVYNDYAPLGVMGKLHDVEDSYHPRKPAHFLPFLRMWRHDSLLAAMMTMTSGHQQYVVCIIVVSVNF